jgi:prefoldin subunit 5
MDASSPRNNVVDVNSLSVEDLSGLQQQLNAELAFFNDSLTELRNVSSKFGRCQMTLDSISSTEKNKPALIPLSESVSIDISTN